MFCNGLLFWTILSWAVPFSFSLAVQSADGKSDEVTLKLSELCAIEELRSHFDCAEYPITSETDDNEPSTLAENIEQYYQTIIGVQLPTLASVDIQIPQLNISDIPTYIDIPSLDLSPLYNFISYILLVIALSFALLPCWFNIVSKVENYILPKSKISDSSDESNETEQITHSDLILQQYAHLHSKLFVIYNNVTFADAADDTTKRDKFQTEVVLQSTDNIVDIFGKNMQLLEQLNTNLAMLRLMRGAVTHIAPITEKNLNLLSADIGMDTDRDDSASPMLSSATGSTQSDMFEREMLLDDADVNADSTIEPEPEPAPAQVTAVAAVPHESLP